jgi:hypothetical protein
LHITTPRNMTTYSESQPVLHVCCVTFEGITFIRRDKAQGQLHLLPLPLTLPKTRNLVR